MPALQLFVLLQFNRTKIDFKISHDTFSADDNLTRLFLYYPRSKFTSISAMTSDPKKLIFFPHDTNN
jgi:hypothetical protein